MSMSSTHGYDWVTFDDDEEIIWEDQPRAISVLKTAIVVFGIAAVFLLVDYVIGGVAIGVAATITGLSYKRTLNTDYVLTNKRLYRKTGYLTESTESAPLHQIQNTSMSKDIIGSWKGFGTVSISTAAGGGSTTGNGDIRIKNIRDASEFKRILTEQTGKNTAHGDYTRSSTAEEGNDEEIPVDELTSEIEQFRENITMLNEKLGDR